MDKWIIYGESMDLVGGIPTHLKNMKVNWDDYNQYTGKQNSCSSHHQPVDTSGGAPVRSLSWCQ